MALTPFDRRCNLCACGCDHATWCTLPRVLLHSHAYLSLVTALAG